MRTRLTPLRAGVVGLILAAVVASLANDVLAL
ncbi:MAG: hypothetical protein QOJ35_3081, partial [Solirubrobacteraceae bacterium]|nr:hypothetical protein [Solirubrobacteraceae bacterium]